MLTKYSEFTVPYWQQQNLLECQVFAAILLCEIQNLKPTLRIEYGNYRRDYQEGNPSPTRTTRAVCRFSMDRQGHLGST